MLSGEGAHRDLDEIIGAPEHRVNILKKYTKIIPGEIPIQIGRPEDEVLLKLGSKSRSKAVDLAKVGEERIVRMEGVEHIVGPVVEARIEGEVHFTIGKNVYYFYPDLIDTIRETLGKVVSMDAQAMVVPKNKYSVSKVFNLNVIDEWTFTSIKNGDRSISLSAPLSASVHYRDRAIWLVDKDRLGIIGAGENWDEAIEDFNFNFRARSLGYGGEPDENLTEDAKALGDKLRRLVPEWNEVLAHAR